MGTGSEGGTGLEAGTGAKPSTDKDASGGKGSSGAGGRRKSTRKKVKKVKKPSTPEASRRCYLGWLRHSILSSSGASHRLLRLLKLEVLALRTCSVLAILEN